MTPTLPRPSEALLRTFAAVPLPCRVLDAGCGTGRHLAALALLGFDATGFDRDPEALASARVAAPDATCVPGEAASLPFADDAFGWIVAFRLLDGEADPDARRAVLADLRRVLVPGGWIFVAEATEAPPALLTAAMAAAGFVLAEAPVAEVDTDGAPIVRGIYRRVEADTVR